MHRPYMALAVSAALLLAIALVFGQTVRHEFVNFDDHLYVYENPRVMDGLTAKSVAWAFTASHANNWHPLTWLSHMLDYQFYGLKPSGHHLSNVLLHAATAVLLFLVLRRMTGDLWPSALVAAIFAVHPLRAESVAWVAERKDVLSGLFFMLTLAAYVGYARRPASLLRYLSVVVLFALGLMAKPMLVTVPFVLLLLDYWPLERWRQVGQAFLPAGDRQECLPHPRWRLVIEKIPLLALAAASCVATPLAQGQAVTTLDLIPISSRISNALVSYVAYVGQLCYPAGLAVYYPHPGSSPPIHSAIGAFLALTVVSVAAVLWRRRFPYVFVGWFWYMGMLVPVIGLVQVGAHAMADRYTYLPQIGLCIAIVWGAARMVVTWPAAGWVRGVGAMLAVLVLMACAWQQTSYWRDNETLWNRDLACASENAVAHNNLGHHLADRGRLGEAIDHYQMVLKIRPDHLGAHHNLGNALFGRGQVGAAIEHYQKALQIKPDFAEAHTNLATALASQGQFNKAVDHYQRALEIDDDNDEAHYSFGIALARYGRFDEAIAEYRQALKLNPGHAEARNNLGVAMAACGQIDGAIDEYRKALKIRPDFAAAHNSLGAALANRGQIDEAVACFQKAVEIKPDLAAARNNLGMALQQQGRNAEAVSQWREVLRLEPNHIAVMNQLAWVLATCAEAPVRNGTEAVALAQRAVQLSGGRDPAILDTLAAAYAEAGQYSAAVLTARKALQQATQENKPALVSSLNAKILLYEAGAPFRETPKPLTARPGNR